jgi:hypothetical protein
MVPSKDNIFEASSIDIYHEKNEKNRRYVSGQNDPFFRRDVESGR